jgi:hypothetical protein
VRSPPTPTSRAYGYEMPPTLISKLVHETTWALFSPNCRLQSVRHAMRTSAIGVA